MTHGEAPARQTSPRRWISDVSNAEVVGLVAWLTATFAISFASTHALVDRALALPAGASLGNHFLIGWAETRGGALLLLSIIAGCVVFRRRTSWEVVLTWPLLVGPVVGIAYFTALTGQMDGGSRFCDAPAGSSCDTAFGFGAILIALAAAVVLGGTFIAAAALKRLLLRSHPYTR